MFTKMAHEAFMKLKQVRRRSWGGATKYIYIYVYVYTHTHLFYTCTVLALKVTPLCSLSPQGPKGYAPFEAYSNGLFTALPRFWTRKVSPGVQHLEPSTLQNHTWRVGRRSHKVPRPLMQTRDYKPPPS